MHPEERHFYGDVLPSFPSIAESAPDPFSDDLALLYASEEAQEALLNGALAIGHGGTIAAALGYRLSAERAPVGRNGGGGGW